jgi:hypothetical protein
MKAFFNRPPTKAEFDAKTALQFPDAEVSSLRKEVADLRAALNDMGDRLQLFMLTAGYEIHTVPAVAEHLDCRKIHAAKAK